MARLGEGGGEAHRVRGYAAWRLPPSLWPAATYAWVYEGGAAPSSPQLVLPHGEPSLGVLQHGQNIRLVALSPARQPRFSRLGAGERFAALQLTPESAAALFDLDPKAMTQTIEDAPPALARRFAPALERIPNASAAEALTLLAETVRAFMARADIDATPERRAARILRRSSGAVAFALIATRLGVSERHLRRRFRDSVGLSPKSYARQIRLCRALRLADAEAAPAWAAIAAACGYFDQPHLIGDAKRLTGLTPATLHALRRGESGFSNSAKAA